MRGASFGMAPWLMALALVFASQRPFAAAVTGYEAALTDEDRLDLYCLKKAYRNAIGKIFLDDRGNMFLTVNGQAVLFRRAAGRPQVAADHEWDISESMAQPYPPEPLRPPTPPGLAPGRKRSYALLEALYGASPQEVARHLESADFFGQKASLNSAAAAALRNAAAALGELADLRRRGWLKVDGSYIWRKIAGENAPSAHSYGIAIDLGAQIAPYWRWCRIRPHPMQASYPHEIVEAFERSGFIWGGKWHEYDLMHFEYRPELLCKGRILAAGSE